MTKRKGNRKSHTFSADSSVFWCWFSSWAGPFNSMRQDKLRVESLRAFSFHLTKSTFPRVKIFTMLNNWEISFRHIYIQYSNHSKSHKLFNSSFFFASSVFVSFRRWRQLKNYIARHTRTEGEREEKTFVFQTFSLCFYLLVPLPISFLSASPSLTNKSLLK